MVDLARFGLRCPGCGAPLGLETADGEQRCSACGRSAGRAGDVLDLVSDQSSAAERAYYEEQYTGREATAGPMSLDSLEPHWRSLYYPENAIVRERLGELEGKRILLVGNGDSEKELYFLTFEPESLVVSDLSPAAVRRLRDRFELGKLSERACFAAVDAHDLPLLDESMDIVYAYASVHHVRDVPGFLAETERVLRPGGRAVFADSGYSPAWQLAKRTALRPLMRYFHRLEPPSPEDLRYTLHGGFREEELAGWISRLGAEPWFERLGFTHYLVTRASERLPPQRLLRRLGGSEPVLRTLIRLDDFLGRAAFMRRSFIRLVWGFTKPAEQFERPIATESFRR
jgi:ubiquinone/menaquinone biosynthesis C-methylase UbiE